MRELLAEDKKEEAETFGVPDYIHERAFRYVPEHLLDIIVSFNETVRARNVIK